MKIFVQVIVTTHNWTKVQAKIKIKYYLTLDNKNWCMCPETQQLHYVTQVFCTP